jgi:hypothetical protein
MAFKLALSVAFPLVLAAAQAPRTLRDGVLRLSWIAFAIGVLQAYLLAETGARGPHGNFTWGAQVTAFVLFAASARWWLLHGGTGPRPFLAGSACAVALAAHVAVGLAELGAFARSGPPFAPAVHDRGERP